MKKKYRIAKVDEDFLRKIEEVKLEKIKNGTLKTLNRSDFSVRRFTKAMARYKPLWEILKEAEFKEENIK